MMNSIKAKLIVGRKGILHQANNYSFNSAIVAVNEDFVLFEDKGTWMGMPMLDDLPNAPYLRCLPISDVTDFRIDKIMTKGVNNKIVEDIILPAHIEYDFNSVLAYSKENSIEVQKYDPDDKVWHPTQFADLNF